MTSLSLHVGNLSSLKRLPPTSREIFHHGIKVITKNTFVLISFHLKKGQMDSIQVMQPCKMQVDILEEIQGLLLEGSRVQSFSFILSPVCMPTCSKLTSCAVYCLLWLSSSLAAPNPFLCCSLLVACKDSVSAMLKELFTVLHGITVSPHQICCVQTLL